jgi:hypothetical protein
MDMSDYEITEKDIESVVNYLKIFHPENANREFAVEMLEYLKTSFHRLALTDPDVLDELYTEFKSSTTQQGGMSSASNGG